MNEILAKVPNEGRLIKQSYLKNLQCFEFDRRHEKKRWAEVVTAYETRVVLGIDEQFKADME